MAKGKWDVRKIPERDKELRSLYMSPTTVKNMKGKAQNIKWEQEKKAGKYGTLKSEYTFQKESKKKSPIVKGTRKQEYKDPLSSQSVEVKKSHKSRKLKGGGRETYRQTDVSEKSGHNFGELSQGANEKKGEGFVREVQDKKGKITKREYLLNKVKAAEKAKAKAKAKAKKTVKQKTSTYQGKKGDTIKPKTKESTTEYWRKSKKGPGYVPEKKKPQYDFVPSKKDYENFEKRAKKRKESVKNENDDRVQKQIKSGFGDWVSSDNFGKKMKSDFAKKKKGMLSAFDKKKKEQESSFEKKKREMKASFEKKKKSMGG
jgi:hypothetical protein